MGVFPTMLWDGPSLAGCCLLSAGHAYDSDHDQYPSRPRPPSGGGSGGGDTGGHGYSSHGASHGGDGPSTNGNPEGRCGARCADLTPRVHVRGSQRCCVTKGPQKHTVRGTECLFPVLSTGPRWLSH
ncbi:glycoprotein Xg isoform X2 [Nannospalax galili]|uniref:glycoprotein Xg isoform X2 n=1 Tax=Nannospalax galili TaxID=1026970 RepID=UPI00111C4577|nr:glycoprotein Xg isoform X2 [Nannospalax galili]